MALYVHITDECKGNAQNFNLSSELDGARRSIETNQSLLSFTYLAPSVLKKKIGRPFRLIAWQHALADDQLIVFLRIFQRRPKNYTLLLQKLTANPQPYTDAELRKIHADLTTASPAPPRPPPSDEERAWLEQVFQEKSPSTDIFVFETPSWVAAMRDNDRAALYNQLLDDMTDIDTLKPADPHEVPIHSAFRGDVGIAYHYRPDLDSILLLEPLRGNPDQSLCDKYLKRLADTDDLVGLSRLAARSYPLLIALDLDAWLAIQNDDESNLALSPEEARIIGSIQTAGADTDLAYPLFINGLAGSGKSTILQYLASIYVDFSLRRQTCRLPLYLTASKDLLERARRTVKGLITTSHETDPPRSDRLRHNRSTPRQLISDLPPSPLLAPSGRPSTIASDRPLHQLRVVSSPLGRDVRQTTGGSSTVGRSLVARYPIVNQGDTIPLGRRTVTRRLRRPSAPASLRIG